MNKSVDSIVFRRLTYADFRHINKRGGEETNGGGQAYIDFPISKVALIEWRSFLGNETSRGAAGPVWEFPINSLGITGPAKNLKIFQRRAASVSIGSQKIHSRASNRVPAWHPDNSFPIDYNPNSDNLVVYIVKTTDNEYWAGWFLKTEIPKNWPINEDLKQMFEENSAGYIVPTSDILIDTENKEWAFYFENQTPSIQAKSDEAIEQDLLLQDISPKLRELTANKAKPEFVERISKIRKRNPQIVKNLKALYKGKCQISGEEFTFKMKNGEFYSEVHHLISLGENGSDSYENAIVVSPLIHRMLHYARVSPIDLAHIKNNKLSIKINDTEYVITWLPNHFDAVSKAIQN